MSGSFPYVVLIISNTYGGVLTYTKNLINKIPDNQFNILPYFIAPSIEYQKNDLKQNQYFLTLKHFVPNPMSLFRFFNSNAQLIHSNFAGIGLLAVISKFLFKIPFVLTLHGFPEPRSRDRFFDKIKYSIEKNRKLSIMESIYLLSRILIRNGQKKNLDIKKQILSSFLWAS
ncbi:MAG: hypothetical protein P8Y18_03480 [Candidatus Bathyarchaeota archaeon]